MTNLEKLITSEYLYPLWRIGWIEKAFFLACRKFGRQEAQKLFTDVWRGHDVSYYQGFIDFLEMVLSGATFVIPRLGYGTTKDVRFDEYMAGVNGVLPNNPYHFYHPELSPVAQADKVLAILSPYQPRISRVWLDMEYEWGGAYTDSKHWKTYRDGINTVYRTGIYTRATWWDSRVGTLAAEFARDPLWAAQYSTALTLIPKGWTKAMIWQSGSPTYDAGQTSPRIDYDLWNTDFDFVAEWGSSSPPPIGEPMAYKATAIYNDTRVRTFHNTLTTSTSIGYYPAGTVFEGNNIWTATAADMVAGQAVGDKWLQTVKPIAGWVAIVHGGKAYCNLETVTPPPPPPPAEIVKELNMQLATGSVVTYTENGVEKWKVTA